MSYRQKRNGTWVVEIYDPKLKRKAHVRPRDHGMEPPRSERQAKALERAALNARDSRRAGAHDETCRSFAERWPDEYGGRGRGESTREHNRERVRLFGAPPADDAPDDAPDFSDRSLRSITREEGRTWAAEHPSMVPALRAMFNDAIRDKLADENPFAKLGLEQTKGREDITVLTRDEITLLGETSLAVYGPDFGREFAAMIAWQAFTCVRTGETFATRYSLLEGDTYHLRKQWNSRLRKETAPKYNGVGTIYVPEPAQRAVLDKPRRLGDDLMFTTKRGKQFRQESLHRWWMPVRAAFMAKLPPGHHLRERLAAGPRRRHGLLRAAALRRQLHAQRARP